MIPTKESQTSQSGVISEIITEGTFVPSKDTSTETQSDEINFNKPWRIKIRRSVINGRSGN